MNDMNPARQAFEDELHEVILEAITCSATPLHQVITNAADRLIELARRVINEE